MVMSELYLHRELYNALLKIFSKIFQDSFQESWQIMPEIETSFNILQESYIVVTVTHKILQVSSMILGCHKVSQDFETNLEHSCKIHARHF